MVAAKNDSPVFEKPSSNRDNLVGILLKIQLKETPCIPKLFILLGIVFSYNLFAFLYILFILLLFF